MQMSLKKMDFSFEVIDYIDEEFYIAWTDKIAWCEYINLKFNTIQYNTYQIILGNEKENFPFNVNIQTIKQFHNTNFFLLFNH